MAQSTARLSSLDSQRRWPIYVVRSGAIFMANSLSMAFWARRDTVRRAYSFPEAGRKRAKKINKSERTRVIFKVTMDLFRSQAIEGGSIFQGCLPSRLRCPPFRVPQYPRCQCQSAFSIWRTFQDLSRSIRGPPEPRQDKRLQSSSR